MFEDRWFHSERLDPKTGKTISEDKLFDDLPLDEQRMWYQGVCSSTEVDRILNMKNGSDYILKLRADTIVDHTRLWRLFLHLSRQHGSDWSLERYFEAKNYPSFKNALSKENKEKIEGISYGSIYSNEPNGLIFQSPFGICTVFSVSLRYFSLFSNLALLECDGVVPAHVAHNGLRIAARIMLGKEALDFEMDPRGIIPEKVKSIILTPYPFQSLFLAGHEYSHYLLGHLDDKKTLLRGINKPHFVDETDYKKINVYTISQKHEFDADLGAMNYPQFNDDFYGKYYFYTLLWFAALAIYEGVEDTMFPPIGYPSHPGAIARYNNIVENARRPKNFEERLFCEEMPKHIEQLRKVMIEDCQINTDDFEMYGSIYLDAPNTAWRGRELVDRVDY